MIENYVARFGSHPQWQEYLGDLARLQTLSERYLSITSEQKQNPESIPRWPPPSRLVKKVSACQPFLTFLHTWLYDDTSAQAHLNAAGMAQVGAFMMTSVVPGEAKRLIEERTILQYTYVHFTRMMTVVLAIATEIDAYRKFANREAIIRLWTLMSGFVDEAREVYERRYQAMWS